MTISQQYQQDLTNMHKRKSFGNRSKLPQQLKDVIEQYQIQSILDFGCGKGNLVKTLREEYPNMKVYGYDPGNAEFSTLPAEVDLIYSTDVLEHIEPEFLSQTIADLSSRTSLMYHIIACHPAKKFLPDGRNAHLIIEPPLWWNKQLQNLKDYTILTESTKEWVATPKKGPTIDVVKYEVLLKRNA